MFSFYISSYESGKVHLHQSPLMCSAAFSGAEKFNLITFESLFSLCDSFPLYLFPSPLRRKGRKNSREKSSRSRKRNNDKPKWISTRIEIAHENGKMLYFFPFNPSTLSQMAFL
jgi:hypothetical protein